MLMCWPQLMPYIALILYLPTSRPTPCPPHCSCPPTGKRRVRCLEGSLPLHSLDPNVEILEIAANPLPLLAQIFQHFRRLEELTLTRCGIEQIAQHAFWGVPSLRRLILADNRIRTLHDHHFRGLANLAELDLSANRIGSVESGVFRHLTELRILNLERNLMRALVPRMFLKLGKLRVLKLGGNPFEDFNPEVFKDVPELHILECRSCGLRRINPQTYHLLPYLTHLDLGANFLQFLPREEFHSLHRLQSLHLDGNQLPVILEHTFVQQHQLQHLNLAHNRLAKITTTAFVNLTSLETLDFGYNRLDRIEMAAFDQLAQNLKTLIISGNGFGLSVIRNLLQVLEGVIEVEIAEMGLRRLPRGLMPARVKRLNVSGNWLSELEHLPLNLEKLDASFNNLTELTSKLVGIKWVNLIGNPWRCTECNLTGFYNLHNLNKLNNLTCASPRTLKNKEIASLKWEEVGKCGGEEEEEEFKSGETLGLILGVGTLIALFIICLVFVICVCMKRRRGLEKRGLERRENRELSEAYFCSKGCEFPLDLGAPPKVQVSTIDDICDVTIMPNGI